tara:strand:+ start:293 stop:394 length:102 start_codon:yes stop_codon:yes gene_type:complete
MTSLELEARLREREAIKKQKLLKYRGVSYLKHQ